MSIFDDHIMYTDYQISVIGKFPTNPKKEDKPITLTKVPHPFDLKVFHSAVQKGNKGKCSLRFSINCVVLVLYCVK
jgi:hypothetical protein